MIKGICLNKSNPVYRQWLNEGYSHEEIYEEYVLNNYFLPSLSYKQNADIINMINKILPEDSFQVGFIKNLKKAHPDAVAAFFNNTLYFGKNAKKGEVAEESFHAIMQSLLTKEERQQMLEAGKMLLNSRLTKEGKTENQFIQENIERFNLKESEAKDYLYEEEIAKEFVNYYLSGDYSDRQQRVNKLSNKLSFLGELSYKISSFLINLFDKLKSLIGFSNKNKMLFLTTFDKIKNGDLRNRKIITSESLYTVPSFQLYKVVGDQGRQKFVSPTIIQKLVANIAFTANKYAQNNPEMSDIEILDMAMNNWADYYDNIDSNSDELQVLDSYDSRLKEDIQKYLKTVYAWNGDFDEDEFGQTEDEEGGFTGWDSSANEKDFKGYSKDMKTLIINSGESITVKNSSNEEVLIYRTPDPAVIYSGLVRAGSNAVTDSERLKKLVNFSQLKGNDNSRIFIVDKLLGDFFDGKSNTYYKGKSLYTGTVNDPSLFVNKILEPNFDLKELKSDNNSAVTNLTLALNAFDLWSRDMKIMAFNNNLLSEDNKEYGLTQSFTSNQNGVVQIQMNNWINNYNHIRQSILNIEDDGLRNEARKQFLSKLQGLDELTIGKKLKHISNAFNLNLSESFIDEYTKLLSGEEVDNMNISDVNYISLDKITTYLSVIGSTSDKFTYLNDQFPDFFGEFVEETLEEGGQSSDVSTFFKALAKGNGIFDESILENSFQNMDGKTIYGFQWATNTQRFARLLTDPVFIEKINRGNPYVGQSRNPDKAFFTENPISNFLLKYKDNKSVLSNIKHKTLDGFKETILKVRKNGSKTRENSKGEFEEKGVPFGDLKYRDFAAAMFTVFLEESTINNKFGEELKFTSFFMGQNEASKITDFISVPIYDLLDVNGNLTEEGESHFYHLINLERQRILDTTELLEKYYGTDSDGNPVSFSGEITREDFQKRVNYKIDIFEKYHTGKVKIVNGKVDYSESKLKGLDVSVNLQGYYSKEDFVKEMVNPSYEFVLNERLQKVIENNIAELEKEKVVDFSDDKFNYTNSLLPRDYYLPSDEKSPKKVGFMYSGNIYTDAKRNLAHVILNMWLNTTYLNQLRIGDTVLNYKNDFSDPLKRNRVDNAAGSSIATELGNSYYGIDPIQKLKFLIQKEPKGKSDIDGGNIDASDAQGTGSVELHLKTDYGTGRMNTRKFELFKKFYEGIDSELEEIEELQHWHQVKKTVAANGSYKIKLSMRTLNKPQTAFKIPISEKEFLDNAYIDQRGLTKQIPGKKVEVSHDFNGNYFKWIMLPDGKELHERRMVLDGWRLEQGEWVFKGDEYKVDFLIPPTAIKSATKNVIGDFNILTGKDNYFTQEIDANAYKLQVENPVGKTAIYDPTQQLEITINEIDGEITLIDSNGVSSTKTADEIVELYQDYISERDTVNFDIASNEIFKEGEPHYSYFIKKLQETLAGSNTDIQTLEMLQEETIVVDGKTVGTGKFKFNPNIPLVKEKFMQMYFKHFTTGVLAQKVDGDALAHISPDGYVQLKKIVKNKVNYKGKDKIVYSWEVIKKSDPDYLSYYNEWNIYKNSAKELTYDVRNTLVGDGTKDELNLKLAEWHSNGQLIFTDNLRHLKPKINGDKVEFFVSEALMPRWYSQKGIPEGLKYQYGVRIPTQDKQSSVNVEWVDELPIALGNSVVVPKEIVQLSGSDFDIDKLFVHRYAGYWEKDNFKLYDNSFKSFYKNIFTKNKLFKSLIKDFLKNDEKVLALKEQKRILKEKNKKLDEAVNGIINPYLKNLYDILDEQYKNLSEVDDSERKVLVDDILKIGDIINQSKDNNKEYLEAFDNYKMELSKINSDIFKLEKKEKERILKEFKLPTKQEEYEQKFSKGFTDFINNKMLDIKISVLSSDKALYSKSNPERGIYDAPATVDQLTNLSKEFFIEFPGVSYIKGIGDKDVFIDGDKIYPFLTKAKKPIFDKQNPFKQTFSPLNFFAYQNAVQVGKSGISYSVNANLMGIVAKRAGLTHQFPLAIKRVNLSDTVLSNFKYFIDGTDKRVFDVISTIITATTDEAKEGQLARHNINENALKVVSLMVLKGMPLGNAIMLLQNPAVKEFERMSSNQDIKTKIEKTKSDFVYGNDLIYEAIIKKPLKKPDIINEVDLLESVFDSKVDPSRDAEILAGYIHLLNSYDSLSMILPLIKGKKGFGKSIDTLESYINSITDMNLDELKDPQITNLYNFRDALLGNKKMKHLINIRNIYKKQWKFTRKVFTERTDTFKQVKSLLDSNVTRSRSIFNKNLNGKVDTFLIGQIIKYYSDSNKLDLDILHKDFLTSDLLIGDNSLVNRILKSDDDIKKIILSKFKTILGNRNSKKDGKLISKLSLLELGKISPEQQSVLTDVFNSIYLNKKGNEIARDMFRYFALKDGFRFRSNSISKALPIDMFSELSDILDFIVKDLEKPENFLKKEIIIKNVIRVFFTNINNKRFIKKSRKGQKLNDMFSPSAMLKVTYQEKFPLFIESNEFGSYAFIYNDILYKLVDSTDINYTYVPSLFLGNRDVEDMLDSGQFIAIEETRPKYKKPSNQDVVLNAYESFINSDKIVPTVVSKEYGFLQSLLEGGNVEPTEIVVNNLNVVNKSSDKITNIEITKEKYTRELVRKNPDTAYVFTENNYSIKAFPNVSGGGTAVIRPEPNAYAIVTKKKYDYNTKENVDYTDTYENFIEFTEINTKLINDLKNSGKYKIVFPEGFATDKASMPTRFAEWLQETLFKEFGLVTELNLTKTGLISKSDNKKTEKTVEKIQDGLNYYNQALTKEEQKDFFDFGKNVLETHGFNPFPQYVMASAGKLEWSPEFVVGKDGQGFNRGENYDKTILSHKAKVKGSEGSQERWRYHYYKTNLDGSTIIEIPDNIKKILTKITGIDTNPYDTVLINLYPIGRTLGWHTDVSEDYRNLNKDIISVSIGADADFTFANTPDNWISGNPEEKFEIYSKNLKSGDIVTFGGKSRLISHTVTNVKGVTDLGKIDLSNSNVNSAFKGGLQLDNWRMNFTFRVAAPTIKAVEVKKEEPKQESFTYKGNVYKFTFDSTGKVETGKVEDILGIETSLEDPVTEYTILKNLSAPVGVKTFGKQTQKIVEGNINNDIIKATDTHVYHMNDLQQKAFDNVKSLIQKSVENKEYMNLSDLTDYVEFDNPVLSHVKIPKKMWNNMYGITGGGGTGKTTMGEAIKKAFDRANYNNQNGKSFFAAPSHKAATVLQESLGVDSEGTSTGDVYTYASFIGAIPKKLSNGGEVFDLDNTRYWQRMDKPKFGNNVGLVIFDESSMMGTEFFDFMYERLKQSLKTDDSFVKVPIIIFLGDPKQLPPVNKSSDSKLSIGPISMAIFSDDKKSTKLTEIKRSSNPHFNEVFNSLGNQIEGNIERDLNEEELISYDLTKYEELTSESKDNLELFTSDDDFIEDYVNELINNVNPKNAFYTHYNKLTNKNTIDLVEKIRNNYMSKIYGTVVHLNNKISLAEFEKLYKNSTVNFTLDDFLNNPEIDIKKVLSANEIQNLRSYIYGDYVQFDLGEEQFTSEIEIRNEKIFNREELLLENYARNSGFKDTGDSILFEQGVFKPTSRYMVKDIIQNSERVSDFVASLVRAYSNKISFFRNSKPENFYGEDVSQKNIMFETSILYNRQSRLRAYNTMLGYSAKKTSFYNAETKQSYITVEIASNEDALSADYSKDKAVFKVTIEAKNKYISELDIILGNFGLNLSSINTKFTSIQNPFKKSYVGSTHTVQGDAYTNIYVSEDNILGQQQAEEDVKVSSLYTALTRTTSKIKLLSNKKVKGCIKPY